MNINRKIEEIRRKPEHIRVRWVWGAVIVSMFFIFLIWIFSLQAIFQENAAKEKKSDAPTLGETFEQIKKTAPSIKNMPLESAQSNVNSEGVSNMPSVTNESYPATMEDLTTPTN